ncbi:hypothetical protein HHL16_01335 [Pseudoflavitalea sp. G-6-1-2]|uniref:hypothetical protein n=1 Tax=Pseudoflavitalea sp. G-6-1-2 TaxID=2728841 RepID=UPI00146B4DF0|nr:hypothetical protein [Pseudoflavitalea sp. G-6-1-2]NML19491.1 hypothetical protein [Pseudoflavitalea sp. G-6-1-2]
MERGFYNDDIEQLIRQKADQYKMFPSENVWKGIYRSLHTRRKWYGLGLLLFLAGISYLASLQLIAPATPAKKINNHAPASKSGSLSNNTSSINNAVSGPVAVAGHHAGAAGNTAFSAFSPRQMATPPIGQDELLAFAETDLPHAIVITRLPNETIVDELYLDAPKKPIRSGKISETAFPVFPGQPVQPPIDALSEELATEAGAHELKLPDAAAPGNNRTAQADDEKKVNWLQEYAVYELTPPRMRRLGWQLSISPTMNYRKLSSSNSVYDQLNIKGLPAGAIEGKPETLVNHRPALGFEIGSHLVYAVNRNIKLRFGLQFNYSRYDIQAYASPVPEKGKIQLDASSGPRDSLVSYTRIRNFSGEKAEALQNQYFQLSAPIGIEVNVLGNEKLQLNVAGSLQPTYLLNRNSYLITTDFKNYMRAPSLVRRWNINAGAEIFVAYKTGSLKWQVGPQFRYQLLSSYVKEYPIREYLMEYGVKIGVTKTLR